MDIIKKNTIPVSLPIREIVEETPIMRTFKFDYSLKAKPGQFVMMWLPGVDQKPMCIAYEENNEFWITVQKIGPFTEALFKVKEGDLIGISGPFGTNFNFQDGEYLVMVGGGAGCAPLLYAAYEASKKGCKVEFVITASKPEKVLYENLLKSFNGVNVHMTEVGKRGEGMRVLREILDAGGVDRIFACSHEFAMKDIADLAHEKDIFCQLSMERYMKCGFGVCGQCVMDPLGICVCKQGPVMNGSLVRQMIDFGKYHRDSVGRKVMF